MWFCRLQSMQTVCMMSICQNMQTVSTHWDVQWGEASEAPGVDLWPSIQQGHHHVGVAHLWGPVNGSVLSLVQLGWNHVHTSASMLGFYVYTSTSTLGFYSYTSASIQYFYVYASASIPGFYIYTSASVLGFYVYTSTSMLGFYIYTSVSI